MPRLKPSPPASVSHTGVPQDLFHRKTRGTLLEACGLLQGSRKYPLADHPGDIHSNLRAGPSLPPSTIKQDNPPVLMEAPLKLGDRAGTTVQPFQRSQDAWLEKQPLLCASCDSPCTVCTEPFFPLFRLRRAHCLLESYSRRGGGKASSPRL